MCRAQAIRNLQIISNQTMQRSSKSSQTQSGSPSNIYYISLNTETIIFVIIVAVMEKHNMRKRTCVSTFVCSHGVTHMLCYVVMCILFKSCSTYTFQPSPTRLRMRETAVVNSYNLLHFTPQQRSFSAQFRGKKRKPRSSSTDMI